MKLYMNFPLYKFRALKKSKSENKQKNGNEKCKKKITETEWIDEKKTTKNENEMM